jgi:hypothetical protein
MKKIVGPGFTVTFSEDGDPSLPEGVKSIFSGMAAAIAADDMQDERRAAGCPEAHIDLYYYLHEERCCDEMNLASERFMAGQCQDCGSEEGYFEEDQRCAAHRKPQDAA